MINKTAIQQTHMQKNRTALLFGLLAGVAYSASAWGYDAIRLASSNALMPWLQFGFGILLLGALGALIAWLVYRLNHVWVSFIVWLGTGILFARLSLLVQFPLSERFLHAFLPKIAVELGYPLLPSIQARLGLITVFVTILTVIAGMLSITLIENSAEANAPLAALTPLLIWMALFALGGYAVRDNFTAPFTTAIVGADDWAQFALDAQTTPVDAVTARQMRLRSAEPIADLLDRPRRLLLMGYNDWLNTMDVLILFGGTPVRCMVVDGSVNFCERGGP